MSIYEEAEEKLAKLLGWSERLPYRKGELFQRRISPCGADWLTMPRWTKDDGAAFKLMVEHEICCIHYTNGVSCNNAKSIFYSDHNNDKSLATRHAIVLAVITKLQP